jgi:hypothetical protein
MFSLCRHEKNMRFCEYVMTFVLLFVNLLHDQIFVKMYSDLNILLLQRQILYVVENNSIVAQRRILNQTTTRWKKIVKTVRVEHFTNRTIQLLKLFSDDVNSKRLLTQCI